MNIHLYTNVMKKGVLLLIIPTYKFFSARRYLALIASVKFRIGGPKTHNTQRIIVPKLIALN